MRSSLYDPTIAHNKNFAGSPNGRKTMSDDDRRSINHQLIESPTNMRHTGCIEMGRCLSSATWIDNDPTVIRKLD